jgi:hypothetical protein
MSVFTKVGDANLIAYRNNTRQQEIISKKQEILEGIAAFHNLVPTSVLCIGFSSFLFAKYTQEISVTAISDEAQAYLTQQGVKFKYIPIEELIHYRKKFQVVIAVDEFFTYAESDQMQKDLVSQICNLASDYVITTLRDYKNQDYKDREFSQPSVVRDSDENYIFLEAHTWCPKDRASWTSNINVIEQNKQELTVFGPYTRRTMYFKQLAKFSLDSGASDFLVHRNLMYKGLVKKNYEHVITIKFE